MTQPRPVDYTKFPSLLTEDDKIRLDNINKQKKEMEKLFQTKFNEKAGMAWSKVNPVERFARQLIEPTVLAKPVEWLTPPSWGFDYGMTPETFRAESLKISEEQKELMRKQKVSNAASFGMEALRILALSGEPLTDPGEIGNLLQFQDLEYSKEDISYMIKYAQDLLKGSFEQLTSNLPLDIKSVSEEEEIYLRNKRYNPTNTFGSVNFIKNQEDINKELIKAFPPGGAEESQDTIKNRVIKDYTDKLLALGVKSGEKLTDSTREAFIKLVEEAGNAVVLTDEETGLSSVVRVKKDNTIWTDTEESGVINRRLEGYLDQKSQTVIPIGIQGQPLLDQQSKDNAAKDLWDAWYLASNQAGLGMEKFLTSVLPDAFLAIAEKAAPFTTIGGKTAKEESERQIQEWRMKLKSNYERSNLEFQSWLKDYPELNPRTGWAEPGNWTPGKVAYTIVSNAPVMGSALIVAAGTTMLTGGNIVAGALAGSAIMTPVMTSQVVDDAISSGADFEDATAIASGVGILMGAVEIAPWAVSLRIMSPVFMKLVGKQIAKEATTTVTKNLIAKGVIGQGIKQFIKGYLAILTAEELEENIQNIMQNATVKVFNENRGLFEGQLETTIGTFFAVSPLALMGGGASYLNMKMNLPQEVQTRMDTVEKQMVDAGIPVEQAQAIALGKVIESELGQAQVEEAQKKAIESVSEVPEKVTPEVIISKDFSPTEQSQVTTWISRLPDISKKYVKSVIFDPADSPTYDFGKKEVSLPDKNNAEDFYHEVAHGIVNQNIPEGRQVLKNFGKMYEDTDLTKPSDREGLVEEFVDAFSYYMTDPTNRRVISEDLVNFFDQLFKQGQTIKPVVDQSKAKARSKKLLVDKLKGINDEIKTRTDSITELQNRMKGKDSESIVDMRDSITRNEDAIKELTNISKATQKQIDGLLGIKTTETTETVENYEVIDDGQGGKIICG